MKILGLRKGKGGGAYHRLVLPLSKLKATFTDQLTESLVSNYDVVWIHYKGDIHPTLLSLWRKKYGFQIILDIDDTWNIPFNHPSYQSVSKAAEMSKLYAIIADWVVCSTPQIKEMVLPYNENCVVIPNRIPYGEGQYHVIKESKESFMNRKIRVGFCGSISHIEDWLSISGKIKRCLNDGEIKSKVEWVVAGVPDIDNLPKPKWIDKKLAEINTTPENKKKIEANLYKGFQKENRDKWNKVTSVLGKPKVVLGKPVENYIDLYREIDILLCPLVDNDLNSCKSDLKPLEAACTDTYCILGELYREKNPVLNMYPFENWYENIRRLIKDKERLYDLKINTSEHVRRIYDYDEECIVPRQAILGKKRNLDLNVWGITYKDDQQTEYKEVRNTISSVEEKSYLFESNIILNLFK